MKKFKKIAASVAALATAAAMSVGTLAVTANEVTKDLASKKSYTVAEEQFIAEYEDTGYSYVAEFLMDNNVSITDAENIMLSFMRSENKKADGNELKNTVNETRTLPNYYNSTNLSNNQHYGVVISDTGSVLDSNIGFYVSHSSDKYELVNPVNIRALHSGISLSGYYSSAKVFHIIGSLNLSLTSGTPTAICDFPFEICNTNTNEANLRAITSFEDEYNDTNATFRYETYVRGDVNHDGVVNDDDVTDITLYNLHQSMSFNGINDDGYADMDAEYAELINQLAADGDRNGELGIGDMVWISQHKDSNNN